jgi:hypothetical protein
LALIIQKKAHVFTYEKQQNRRRESREEKHLRFIFGGLFCQKLQNPFCSLLSKYCQCPQLNIPYISFVQPEFFAASDFVKSRIFHNGIKPILDIRNDTAVLYSVIVGASVKF